MRRVLAVVTVTAGAVACLYAGYKAGQKNGIPVMGAGTAPAGAILTQGGAVELEQTALKAALEAALLA